METVNDLPQGLTSAAARKRLATDGPNQLGADERGSFLHSLLGIARDPMFILLLGSGSLYLLTGDRVEAGALLGFVLIIISVTALQERHTERALEALKDLSSPRALVVRDGVLARIPGREVVVGDTLMLVEGDRIPADGELLRAHALSVDESLLTGESVPVTKQPMDSSDEALSARLFAGTLIVAGQGWMRVTATGAATEFGQIGQALQSMEEAPSPLQNEIRVLTRRLAWVAGAFCVFVTVAAYMRSGLALPAVLAGITLAMALLPQEFPVIMTVFLALGARRMVRAGVLTRHLQAIETLGQTTALCVDKTGTLTENRMAVASLVANGRQIDLADLKTDAALPEAFHPLLEYAVLASEPVASDPMERAFHLIAGAYLANTEHLHPDWDLVREYELTPALMAMSHGWSAPELEQHVVAAKGAPEAIADLCHLCAQDALRVEQQAAALASRGLRVLAVACSEQHGDDWPERQHDFPFRFVGMIGLADPLRSEVPAAVASCRGAGVAVYMITGDHPTTARVIAEQAGLDASDVLTGIEMEALDAQALARRLATARIFARVSPAQKLRLVQALKTRGEVVAMTGDGVNDAPALKAAHIGVAMGKRGTDVAREAASLVLVEDDFSAIVEAIAHGRRIYGNLMRAMEYTLAVHLPTIALTLVPLLLGLPSMLLPLHIAFLELVIAPSCSIVFESEPGDPDAMQQPPRAQSERLLSPRIWGLAMSLGLSAAFFVLAVYGANVAAEASGASIRSTSFVAIVLANLALIFGIRSRIRLSLAAAIVVTATLFALALVCTVPALQEPFEFATLTPGQLAAALLCGFATWLLAAALQRRAGRRPASVSAH